MKITNTMKSTFKDAMNCYLTALLFLLLSFFITPPLNAQNFGIYGDMGRMSDSFLYVPNGNADAYLFDEASGNSYSIAFQYRVIDSKRIDLILRASYRSTELDYIDEGPMQEAEVISPSNEVTIINFQTNHEAFVSRKRLSLIPSLQLKVINDFSLISEIEIGYLFDQTARFQKITRFDVDFVEVIGDENYSNRETDFESLFFGLNFGIGYSAKFDGFIKEITPELKYNLGLTTINSNLDWTTYNISIGLSMFAGSFR